MSRSGKRKVDPMTMRGWARAGCQSEMNVLSDLDGVEALAPWNFKWIVRGELAIMGYPKCKENVKYLVENGVKHLVSLSPEKQPPFEFFPFEFRWTPIDVLEYEPPTLEQIQAFINTCLVALHNNEIVGVHCRMGRGRSGVMAACYLVKFFNQRPERAVTSVRIAQPGAIETYSQEKAVFNYYDSLRREEPEEEEVDEVDLYISKIPRPTWEFKPRPRKIFDYKF